MKHNAAFKQFAKDCPKHFSEEILKHAHLSISEPIQIHIKEKSTQNSKIRNKF